MKYAIGTLIFTLACSNDPHPVRASDVPKILAAAAGVAGASAHAVEDAPGAECVVLLAAASALSGASETIKGAQQGDVTFPAVHVDVSHCVGWKRPEPKDAPVQVEQALRALEGILPLLQLGPVEPQDACRVSAWLAAVVPYTADVAGAVIDEIQAPDGFVDVRAQTVTVDCP